MKLFDQLNWPITLSILPLLSIGILVIYSSSKDLALQQAFFAVLGMILYFIVSEFDYRNIKNVILPSYVAVFILLLLVLIIGIETRGSARWITIGFLNIQPSEFLKPVLILLLADFWSKRVPSWANIFRSLLWFLIPGLLIFKQPDLGTFITLGALWGGLMFASRISFKKLAVLALIMAVSIPVGWAFLHDYQRQRVTSFLSPGRDPLGTGYNIIQSTIAVGSGQLMGRGLGHGTQSRLQFLPEYRTDFIFASISEELGFIGSVLIILVYVFLISYCLRMSDKATEGFGYLIILGVVTMMLFQVIVNIGMNIGLFPITGITLPLISYGGSSLISTLICLGLVASVIRHRKKVDIISIGS